MTRELFVLLFDIEMGYALIAFLSLIFIAAPYGRHIKKGWGPVMTAKNAWIVQEFPAFAVILYFYIIGKGYENISLTVMLLIWQAHYFHRTFIYPFNLTSPQKPYPVLLVIMAIIFNVINGVLNGSEIFFFNSYSSSWLYSPQFICGTIIFIAGYLINKKSDHILAQLRHNSKEYQIPEGGLYRYISCPNYLGEMMEWLGWAILSWSVAGFGFFIFTCANLLPRAFSNHKWYKQKFASYPHERKAIIPFIL